MINAYENGKERPVADVLRDCFEAIINQGGPCRDLDNCRYGMQGYPSMHCLVGWLLPPDNEELMGDESNVYELTLRYKNLGPNDAFIRKHVDVLMRAQQVHDAYYPDLVSSNISRLLDDYPELKDVTERWYQLIVRQSSTNQV